MRLKRSLAKLLGGRNDKEKSQSTDTGLLLDGKGAALAEAERRAEADSRRGSLDLPAFMRRGAREKYVSSLNQKDSLPKPDISTRLEAAIGRALGMFSSSAVAQVRPVRVACWAPHGLGLLSRSPSPKCAETDISTALPCFHSAS